MAHKVPLTVYCVWLKDHIHTDIEQRLAVFPRLKDAEAWNAKYAGGDLKVHKMQIVPHIEKPGVDARRSRSVRAIATPRMSAARDGSKG